MSSTNERMKAVVTALGFSSNEAFENAVGLGHGFVSRIKSTVSRQSLQKIVDKFPQVNTNYIRTGYGEMFGKEPEQASPDDVKKRFRLYLKNKGITRTEFIKSTGVYATFPLVVKARSFSASTIYKVNSKFPDLNMHWLATGIGDMLQEDTNMDELTNYKQRVSIFCKEMGISITYFLTKSCLNITSLDKLPVVPNKAFLTNVTNAFPLLNMEWIKSNKGNMLLSDVARQDTLNIVSIPLVPQKAYAGYLNGFADDYYISKLPTIPMVRQDNDKYVAFEVSGDSMDDGSSGAYKNGDVVISRICPDYLIKNENISFRHKEFIIVHKEGILLKQIKGIDLIKGTISLHSFNPTYRDLELQLMDVRQILEVVYLQRKRI